MIPEPYCYDADPPVLVTPPANSAEPVTVADLKAQIRETAADPAQEAVMGRIITAVRGAAERELNLSFLETEWDFFLQRWPRGLAPIRVPRSPLRSVTSILSVDPDGAEQTLATSVYFANTAARPGEIRLQHNQSWPAIREVAGTANLARPIRVRFKAGYGAQPSAVPAHLRVGLLMAGAHLWEHREAFVEGLALQEAEMAVRSFFSREQVFNY